MYERELIRERGERRHLRGMVRRFRNEKRNFSESDDEDYNPSRKIRRVDNASNGFLCSVSPKGKLHLNSSDWSKMSDTQQEYVKAYNAAISHGDDTTKLIKPDVIKVKDRRVSNKDKDNTSEDKSKETNNEQNSNKKSKKGITFNVDGTSDSEEWEHLYLYGSCVLCYAKDPEPDKGIETLRGILENGSKLDLDYDQLVGFHFEKDNSDQIHDDYFQGNKRMILKKGLKW